MALGAEVCTVGMLYSAAVQKPGKQGIPTREAPFDNSARCSRPPQQVP